MRTQVARNIVKFRRRSGISTVVGSVFFLLIVFLVFTSIVLIFNEFNGFVGQSNKANQQEAAAKGAALGVSGLEFGGVIAPTAGTSMSGQSNNNGRPLLPISNMNFTDGMKGWFVSRSYSLLNDSAILENSPQSINATYPVTLPGSLDFTLNVTNNDAVGGGNQRAIAYVSIAVDQNFTISSSQKPPPSDWNAPIVVGNTITWKAISGWGIDAKAWIPFTWTVSVPNMNATFFNTVTLKWVSAPSDQLPYVDSGIGTVNTTVAAVASGGISTAVLTPAPSGTIPGGAAGGYDPVSTRTASQSGPGSLYATFAPTFNGAPIGEGQQLVATMNFSTSFTLDTNTACNIVGMPCSGVGGECCGLSWAYSMDELTSVHNPSISLFVSVTREEPFTPEVFDVVNPTLINYFRSTGWVYERGTFGVPPGFWAEGRYDVTVSVMADLPGANPLSPSYPPSLQLHIDDVGMALKLGTGTFYVDKTVSIATGLQPILVQGIDLNARLTGAQTNVSAYVFLEDVTQSQVAPFWVEMTSLNFVPPAAAEAHVPIQSSGLYVAQDGSIQARIYAVSLDNFTLNTAISMTLQTVNYTTVVADFFNNSTNPIHLISLYVSGPTGTSHFDTQFSAPNNFSVWVAPGQTVSVQKEYLWAPGQTYVVTAVSDQSVEYSRAYVSW